MSRRVTYDGFKGAYNDGCVTTNGGVNTSSSNLSNGAAITA